MCRLSLALSVSMPNNFRVKCEIERIPTRRANSPRAKYKKGKVEAHKREIQETPGTLNVLNPPPREAPTRPRRAATTSVVGSGTSLGPPSEALYGTPIAPYLFTL